MAEVVVLGVGLSGTLMAYELVPQLDPNDRPTVSGMDPRLSFRYGKDRLVRHVIGPARPLVMESKMNIDRAVLALAGTMILVSLLLALFLSPYWLLLTAFVGLNLLQSAFTGFCPAAIVFHKMGLTPGRAFE